MWDFQFELIISAFLYMAIFDRIKIQIHLLLPLYIEVNDEFNALLFITIHCLIFEIIRIDMSGWNFN